MEYVTLIDPHFDGPLGRFVPDVNRVILEEFRRGPLAYAKRNAIKHIVITGDICDRHRMTYSAQMAFRELLSDEEFTFHVYTGNHCLAGESPGGDHVLESIIHEQKVYGVLKNVHFYLDVTDKKIEGTKVRFLPWPHNDFDPKRLNFSHIEVKGLKNDNGSKVRGKDLSESKAHIVNGHMHVRQQVRNTHCPGTLLQQTFGDPKDRYFLHGIFNSVKDAEYKYVKHKPLYKLAYYSVNSRKDVKKLPDDPHTLIHLIIEDGANIDPSDYAGRPNIVDVTPFKSRKEMAALLEKNLGTGTDIKFDTEEFITHFINQLDLDEELRTSVDKLRNKHRLKD